MKKEQPEQQVPQDDKERKVQKERRFQTWMVSICAACAPVGLAAMWWIVQQLSAVPTLIKRIDTIDAKLYSKNDAERDFYNVEAKIGALEKQNNSRDTKIDNIDRRVLILETNQALRPKQ